MRTGLTSRLNAAARRIAAAAALALTLGAVAGPARAATAPQAQYLEEFDFVPTYDISGLVNYNRYADGTGGFGNVQDGSRDYAAGQPAVFTEGGIPQVSQAYFMATSSLGTGSPNHLVVSLNTSVAVAPQGTSFASIFGSQYLDGTTFTEQDIVGAVQSINNPGSDQQAINAAVNTIFKFSDVVVGKNDGFTPGNAFQLVGFSDGQIIGSGTSSLTQTSGAPEPATWAMMICGFGIAGAAIRRQRRTSAASSGFGLGALPQA